MIFKVLRKKLLFTFLPASIILWITIIFVCPTSCRSSSDGINSLEGDFSSPEISDFKITSSESATIEFSEEVEVKAIEVFSAENGNSFDNLTSTSEETGLNLEFNEKTEVGSNYVVEGIVTDQTGSSLTFSLPFIGYNENPAKLIITELRNAYATTTKNGTKVHRSEFVELYVLKSGNLSGLEIYSVSDGEKLKYSLPAIEVKKDEYITVHMRTINAEGLDGEGMISELEDDIALSTHEDSCDTARDLWSSNSKAVFKDSDVVVLQDYYRDEIIDAILFAKTECTEWNQKFGTFLTKISENNIWQGGTDVQNVLCSDSITSSAGTRSFARQNLQDAINAFANGNEIPNSKENWIITKSATPGYENSDKAYVPKS